MQQEGRQPKRAPRAVAVERQRARRRTDRDRRNVRRVAALVDVDEHDGHVVGRALVEALLDQPLGRLLGAGHRREDVLHLLVGDIAREPVGADQPAVAGRGVEDGGVDLGCRIHVAEHAHEHGAAGMHGRLFRRDAAGVDEPLHEGVVGRDLLELSAAEPIDAGVADVRLRH